MRILTINSSVHGDKGNTHLVASGLMRGYREAGVESETVFLKTLDIQPCKACFKCWSFTPGRCIINDSMESILDKIHQSNIVVFATPLHFFSWSSIMKTFIDRMMPLLKPWMTRHPKDKALTTHPLRYPNPFKAVLLSSSAFPEREHFTPLVETFRTMCQAVGWEPIATILRPGAELLRVPMMQIMLNWYYDGLLKAGKELALYGEISSETQAVIDRDLSPAGNEDYRKTINEHWYNVLKKGGHDITDYPREENSEAAEAGLSDSIISETTSQLDAPGYGKFSISDFRGKVIVLITGTHRDEKYCEQILKDIMMQFMSAEHICLINLVDVSTIIPRMRPMTLGNMERRYNDALRNIRMWYAFNKRDLPQNMKSRVIISPDWTGEVIRQYSKAVLTNPDAISTVLITHEGKIAKEFTGTVVVRELVDTLTGLLRF